MTSTGSPAEPREPAGAPPHGGAGRFRAVSVRRLHGADLAVAAGTVVYVVLALLPWFRVDGIAVAGAARSPALTVHGSDLGLVVAGAVLLVLATAWTVIMAQLREPLPPAAVTAGLAAVAFLCTLTGWLRATDLGFSGAGLLTVLVSAVVLTCAVLRLPAQLGDEPTPVGAAPAVEGRPSADRPETAPNGSAVLPAAGRPADPPAESGWAPPAAGRRPYDAADRVDGRGDTASSHSS
jgi:hypothetical protein